MLLFLLHTLLTFSYFLTQPIGYFEPYKPYGISVYPRFKSGIGLPQTVNAYLRQKGELPDIKRFTQTADKDLKVKLTYF